MKTSILDLDCLILLEDAVNSVSQAYMDRIDSNHAALVEGQRSFGSMSERLRRLWAAACIAEAKGDEVHAKAHLAETEAESAQLHTECRYQNEISQLAKSLVFCQARRDAGVDCGLTIARGWILAEYKPRTEELLRDLFKRI